MNVRPEESRTDPDRLRDREFDAVAARIGPRFLRRDLRDRAGAYLRALALGGGGAGRGGVRALAAAAGETTPAGFRHLLDRARWDADALRDDLREYVVERLTDPDGEATLIAGEVRFPKRGTKSAGATRRRSPTTGRVGTCQAAVFLAYRTARGCALIDRVLHLPEEWATDPARRVAVGAPDTHVFGRGGVVAPAGTPNLAGGLIRRALDAGVPCDRVVTDETCSFPRFWTSPRRRTQDHVAVVAATRRLIAGRTMTTPEGHLRTAEDGGQVNWEVVPGPAENGRPARWAALPCGRGMGAVERPIVSEALLVREDPAGSKTGAPGRTYFLSSSWEPAPPRTLVEAAGGLDAFRRTVAGARREAGLDAYEVRSWDGWHRHVTLSMLAHAALTIARLEAEAGRPDRVCR
ncbi:IS701 family transposase [Alienimonas californiensis]|uniref:Transposase IS701-like DDE domain-containing protein n=1 Tax=Alienimonas californiensis TaxID=2527989 RepID=A0A517PAZ1_9PLAN|nr:transposase [Alienimonas californiensis]QDT16542.1 hypothetical protein CA12_26480 [Alienimonas californiensis]